MAEFQVSYCQNVHPVASRDDIFENLELRAASIQKQLAADGDGSRLGVGLWFPADIASRFHHSTQINKLRETIDSNQLFVTTFNGFPLGNFHQEVVKKDVYQPTWADPKRVEYTLDLVRILEAILPPEQEGTISTLPLGWPDESRDDNEFFEACNQNLHALASQLDSIRERTGKQISICIEPEPGCVLGTALQTVEFFEKWIFESEGPNWKHEFLKVCHDVCHSAVMMESQTEVIHEYNSAGIEIGKVQVSSAPKAVFEDRNEEEQHQLLTQIKSFAEPRYMHQTMISNGEDRTFFDDLPAAIDHCESEIPIEARIHFHVPIFLESLGPLSTTGDEISETVAAVRESSNCRQFEIETYAWDVLPNRDQYLSLESGIAEEVQWFRKLLADDPSAG